MMASDSPLDRGWRRTDVILAVVMLAIAVLITFNVWQDMLTLSLKDEESGYIAIVPVVIAILVWVRRDRIKAATISQNWIGTLLVGLGWLGWSTGYRTGSHMLWYGGADLMALGAIVTVLGKDALIKFLPAVGALIFLIPVFNGRRHQIAGPLELVTAEITQAICELFRINIERQGNLLIVNGVAMAIAEACNGMRMVFTLVLVSYLYAFSTPFAWYGRLIILVLSPVTAIVCNVIRLVPTAFVFGHASASAAKTFHDVSGWAMIGVGFLLLTLVGRAFRNSSSPESPGPKKELQCVNSSI